RLGPGGEGRFPGSSRRKAPEEKVTRRALIAATAVLGAGAPALAQQPPQPPRVKGPVVWLDMDQQDLDDAYDQAVYAPNRDQILKRCARHSDLVRERLAAPTPFSHRPPPTPP